MDAQRTFSRTGFALFGLGITCLFAVGCNRSHEEAKQVTRTASELNLPSLSAEQQQLSEERLDWGLKNLADAYEKVGSKDPKWDRSARSALTLFAQVRAYGPDVEGFPHTLQYDTDRAVEQGCDDPMIGYLHVRFRADASSLPVETVNRDYGTAAGRLGASAYAPIRKFYAAQRAYLRYFSSSKGNSPAQQAAAGYHNAAVQYFFEFLEEKGAPVPEVDEACQAFLEAIKNWNDEKSLYDRMESVLLKNWPKQGFSYVARGQFYVDYAWHGRSSKTANLVTPEQWKLFRERLAVAASILSEGSDAAPHEGRIPALMIKVVSGQEKGFPEMKRWFERAMEADTNNLTACKNLLYFLLPRWYGSREDMLAFGRQCVASPKWGGTVPLALVEAHYTYNRFDGPPDGSYWRRPEVWPDIKASYEKFFALNPKAKSWRSYYARYAYWCHQWAALREQLDLAGDNIDEEAFGSSEDFNQALTLAKNPPAAAK